VLEAVRQPLEDGRVEISRAVSKVEYPASFQLIGAVNPCPCGFLGHSSVERKCTNRDIDKYKRRISGPILDRIDLQVGVPVEATEKILGGRAGGESSAVIRGQVMMAREVQKKRLLNLGIFCNSRLKNKEIREFCALDSAGERVMRMAVEKYSLSTRGYFRVLKVARTIADLEGSMGILVNHVAEAVGFRERVF